MVIQNLKKIKINNKPETWNKSKGKLTIVLGLLLVVLIAERNEKTVKWNLFGTTALKNNFQSPDA